MTDTWDSFQTDWEPLLNLRAAWLEEYEKEAKGGLGSLKGFQYQFHVYLLRIVEEWLDREPGDAIRSRPSALLEYLADIVQLSPEAVWVTEVKFRQSSSKVQKAMSEFWKIERLARRRVPGLAPKLRYRLVSAKREIKDVSRSIGRWEPRDDVDLETTVSSGEPELDGFKTRIEAEVIENPRDKLLGILVNKLNVTEEPIRIIADWTSALLSAASGEKKMTEVATEIFGSLGALTNRRDPISASADAYLWTEKDRPPATVQPGRVLTGQRPLVWHLREGYFANRAELFDQISERAAAWIGEQEESPDPAGRIPLFWIGGRSGSGKSVALLHVLSNLFDFGFRPILWLGRNLSGLRSTFDLSSGLRDDDQRVILGLDDPFTPGSNASEEWRHVLSGMEKIRNSANTSELPLIFCCGPSEQLRRLEGEFCEELEIESYEVPRESLEEVEALRAWFRRRRGQEPPDLVSDNALLVQLFFEWRTGEPLPEFALRFRKRIQLADADNDGWTSTSENSTLEEFLATMLAANRIYVGLPAASRNRLSARQKDSLSRLRAEHHIQETAKEAGASQEVWLAHSHLSNAIFESWFPREDANQRARFGSEADAIWLKSGNSPSEKMAFIWALGTVLLENQNEILGSRLGETEIPLLLSRAYKTHKSHSEGGLQIWQLPAWIQVCASGHDESLTPHPVEESLDKLGSIVHEGEYQERGLRLTCTKLLEFFDHWPENLKQKSLRVITELLMENPEWHEWPYVALELLPYSANERFFEATLDWIRDNSGHRMTPQLLRHGIQRSSECEGFLAEVSKMLPTASGERGWSTLAEAYLDKKGGEGVEIVKDWLARNASSKFACFVIRELFEYGDPSVISLAETWLAEWHRSPVANFVLERLLEEKGLQSNKTLLEQARSWIDCGYEDSSHLMQQLIRISQNYETGTELASRWLNDRREHGSWLYVWNEAVDRWPSFSDSERGREILENLSDSARGATSLIRLSGALSKIGNWKEAVEAAEKALADDPESADAKHLLSWALGQQDPGDPRAFALLEEIAKEAQTVEDWLRLSRAKGGRGDAAGSLAAARQALSVASSESEVLEAKRGLSRSLSEVNEEASQEEGLALLEEIAKEAQTVEDWLRLSRAKGGRGDAEGALAAARQAVSIASTESETLEAKRGLSRSLSEVDDEESHKEGLALLEEVAEEAQTVEDWLRLSRAKGNRGDAEGALAAARQAVSIASTESETLEAKRELGSLMARHRGREVKLQGVKLLRKTVGLDETASAWRDLGFAYGDLKFPTRAVANAIRALKIDPSINKAWRCITLNFRFIPKGRQPAIIDVLRNLALDAGNTLESQLTEDPTEDGLWQLWVWTATNEQQYDRILLAAKKMLSRHPDSSGKIVKAAEELTDVSPIHARELVEAIVEVEEKPYYLNLLSKILRELGDASAALAWSRKSIVLDPEFGSSFYGLGKTFELLEEIDEAIVAYRKGGDLGHYKSRQRKNELLRVRSKHS